MINGFNRWVAYPFILLGWLMVAGAHQSQGGLIYYNDGTVNDFDATFGDVGFGVPYNAVFEPGGFLDGSAADIPPFNTIVNPGLVTYQGAAGGVAGGGFFKKVANPAGAKKGAIVYNYGSVAEAKDPAGANWIALFADAGRYLGVNAADAKERWRQGIELKNGTITKLMKYIGDPQVSVPLVDLEPGQLDPIDLGAVTAALADDNTLIFFWEVTGDRPMEALDLFLGDFEQNTGYLHVSHHFPYLAVLADVGPGDFGIDPSRAFIAQFNGDSLSGSGGFTQTTLLVAADPVATPENGSALMIVLAALSLLGFNQSGMLADRRRALLR